MNQKQKKTEKQNKVEEQKKTNKQSNVKKQEKIEEQNKVIKISFNKFLAILISFVLVLILAIILGVVLIRKLDGIENKVEEKGIEKDTMIETTKPNTNAKISNENIGDTVNYKVNVNDIELDKWSLFYSEGNTAYIIYDELLPNSTNIASNAGLTQDKDKHKEFGVFSGKSRNDLLNKLSDVKEENLWDRLVSPELRRKGATASGGIDVETWVKSWNSKGYTKLITNTIDFSDGTVGYEVKKASNTDAGSGILNISSDRKGYGNKLYFPTINSKEEEEDYYGYWIASASSLGNNYLVIITEDGEIGNNIHGYNDAKGVGIRPVITLPIEILEKSTNTDKSWDIVTDS